MAFSNLPASKPAPRRSKDDLILGVGSHAYVNWSQPVGQPLRAVPMLNATGQMIANDLVDGQEVEILSWRPRSRDGLSYQVSRVNDGTVWWISAVYLRRRREA